jgi:hypothetical protein
MMEELLSFEVIVKSKLGKLYMNKVRVQKNYASFGALIFANDRKNPTPFVRWLGPSIALAPFFSQWSHIDHKHTTIFRL